MVYPEFPLSPFPCQTLPRPAAVLSAIRVHPWSKPRFTKVEWLRPSFIKLHSIRAHSRTFVSIRVKKVTTTDGTDSHGSIQPTETTESPNRLGLAIVSEFRWT